MARGTKNDGFLNISTEIKFDTKKTLARLQSGVIKKAQQWLDNEVLKDTAQYVPMRSGDLMRSGNNATKLGSGNVVYNMPYARKVYYGYSLKFSKDKHPLASAAFFEKSKAVNLKKWETGTQRIINGQ